MGWPAARTVAESARTAVGRHRPAGLWPGQVELAAARSPGPGREHGGPSRNVFTHGSWDNRFDRQGNTLRGQGQRGVVSARACGRPHGLLCTSVYLSITLFLPNA